MQSLKSNVYCKLPSLKPTNHWTRGMLQNVLRHTAKRQQHAIERCTAANNYHIGLHILAELYNLCPGIPDVKICIHRLKISQYAHSTLWPFYILKVKIYIFFEFSESFLEGLECILHELSYN